MTELRLALQGQRELREHVRALSRREDRLPDDLRVVARDAKAARKLLALARQHELAGDHAAAARAYLDLARKGRGALPAWARTRLERVLVPYHALLDERLARLDDEARRADRAARPPIRAGATALRAEARRLRDDLERDGAPSLTHLDRQETCLRRLDALLERLD